jgi:hypothetical protein
MYCLNCGNSDQQAATYCRRCGTLQPDPSKPYNSRHISRSFATINTVFSALSALASFVVAFILWTIIIGFGGGLLIHLMVAALVAVGLCSAYASWRSFQLQSDFKSNDDEFAANSAIVKSLETPPITDKLLNEPDFENAVPPSVTDSTTKHLVESQIRSS